MPGGGGGGPTVRLTFTGDENDLTRSMDRVGNETAGLGKRLDGMKAGMAAAGAAGALALGDAFSQSLDIGTAQAKLKAQLGEGNELSSMAGDVAGKLYASAYGESMGDVTEAVRTVGQGIADMTEVSAEDLQKITGQAMSLAQAFDQDLNSVVRAADQLITTGLAPNAEAALDLIAKGFQMGINDADDLLDTLSEYGTQFRKLGLDGATAMGLMSQGIKAGARDLDLVADALKEFSIRAIDGSDSTREGFAAIGLSADDMAKKIAQGGPTASAALDLTLDRLRAMKDPVAQNAAGVALFGTQWEDMGAAMAALDVSTATQGLGEVAGAAAQVDAALGDTAAVKIETAKRAVTGFMNGLVETKGPLGDFAAGLVGFGPDTIAMAGSIGMIVIAMRGLAIWQPIVTAAQWLWNAALSANPIGLIVLAIAGLVAGFIYLWNTSEGFRNFWMGLWAGVQDVFNAAVAILSVGWDRVMSLFTGAPSAIGSALSTIGEVLLMPFKLGWQLIQSVIDFHMAGIRNIPNMISGFFSTISEVVTAPFRAAFDGIRSLWNSTVGRISFTIPTWVPVIGGYHFSMPKFHTGGVVPGMPGSEQLAVLEAGERVIPRDRSGSSGGGTVTFAGNLSDPVASMIMMLIRTGKIQIG